METRRQEVGREIKLARRAKKFRSQRAFAKAIDVHESSVANAEVGSDRIGESVYNAIERGIDWSIGSIDAYLNGTGKPPWTRPVAPTEPPPAGQSDEPWMPVLTDEQIIAMGGYDFGMHYIKLEREYGVEAADDWAVKALIVRRDARRAARGTLAVDGS